MCSLVVYKSSLPEIAEYFEVPLIREVRAACLDSDPVTIVVVQDPGPFVFMVTSLGGQLVLP